MSPLNHTWTDVIYFVVTITLPVLVNMVTSFLNGRKLEKQSTLLKENTAVTKEVKTMLNGKH